MRSADKKSNKRRILGMAVAVAMVVSIIGATLYSDGNKVYAAKVTLRGIDELATKHSSALEDGYDTFIILEIVDDVSDARIGYLVGGEEPVYDGKSIKDMPSKEERIEKLNDSGAAHTYLANNGGDEPYAYTWTDGYNEVTASDDARSIEIRGTFEETGTGSEDYRSRDYSGEFQKIEFASTDELNEFNSTKGLALYRRVRTYSLGSGTSDYKLTLRLRPDDGGFMPQVRETDGDGNIYNGELYRASEITSISGITEGSVIYKGASGDELEFGWVIGSIEHDEETDVYTIKDDEDNDITSSLNDIFDVDNGGDGHVWEVQKTNDNLGPQYYISDVTAGGPYVQSDVKYEQIYGTPGDYYEDTCPLDKGPYWYLDEGVSTLAYEYATSHDGNYNFTADYTKSVYDKFYYENGFNNEEWFKQYVFDRDNKEEYENLSIDVVTVKASDLTEELINKANLVYLSGANGISATNARILNNKVVDENLPIIMEYSVYSDAVNDDEKKLALKLMQKTLSTSTADEWDALVFDESMDDSLWRTTRFYSDLTSGEGAPYTVETKDISYVNGTVFINDNKFAENGSVIGTDFYKEFASTKTEYGFLPVQSEIDSEKTLLEARGVWDQFNSKISKATVIRFILNANNNRIAIKEELKILDIEPMESAQYTNQDDLKSNIWYKGNSVSVRTMERDTISNEWVKNYLIDSVKAGEEPSVNITQMGTKEFIGVNEDLNSKYDLIYIGMDTALMNTKIEGSTKSLLDTIYNYSAMDGTIYSHMGDTISGYSNARGGSGSKTMPGNDITIDKLKELTEYIKAGYAVVLSDGFIKEDGSINDVTVDSSSNMYKLLAWLVKDERIEVTANTKINGSDVDKIVIAAEGGKKYYKKNVQIRGDVENNSAYRDTLIKFINVSKLKLNLISKPAEYNPDMTYLPKNSSGGCSLDFRIKLENDAAIDSGSSSYDCKLYIDMDADGKFEKAEELGGLSINGGDEVESEGVYHLRAGSTYDISRDVPEEYVGFLPWKLEFTQNESVSDGDTDYAKGVRTSVYGYSAVERMDKPTIKVLQIIPNGVDNLDLSNDGPVKQLYDQVKDFNVVVTQIKVSDYILKTSLYRLNKDTGKEDKNSKYYGTYYGYLSQYDMVVTGFVDMYEFVAPREGDNGYDLASDNFKWVPVNNYADSDNKIAVRDKMAQRLAEKGIPYNIPWTGDLWVARWAVYHDAILGLREYAMSGRSVLFTHDLTSFTEKEFTNNSGYTPFGYYANTYLRDIQGMDRFGFIASESTDMSYYFDSETNIDDYNSVYDRYERRGSTSGLDSNDKRAFTDSNIIRFTTNQGYNKLSIGGTTRERTAGYDAPTWWDGYTETVTATNEGQITQYPFLITEGIGGHEDSDDKSSSFTTAATHPQYFQLNMDTCSWDDYDNDDVVVWYTISNKPEDQAKGKRWGYYEYYRANHNDVRNNYYIFSKGNVLYTGAGHQRIDDLNSDGSLKYPEEAKLFINTLVAAYNSGTHSPMVEFKQNGTTGARVITSQYIPFDPDMVGTDGESVTAGYLDNTLSFFFKPTNLNFRNSGKLMYAKFYIEVTGSDTYDHACIGSDGVVHYYKEVTPKAGTKYTTSGVPELVGNISQVENGVIYGGELTLEDLNLSINTTESGKRVQSRDNLAIWVRVGLDNIENSKEAKAIPVEEAYGKLGVYTSTLVDLK